jgi:carbamoyltransferase
MNVFIGTKYFGHDSAAVLLTDDGRIFATSTERYTRYKHDDVLPIEPIKIGLDYLDVPEDSNIHIASCFHSQPDELMGRNWHKSTLAMRRLLGARYVSEFNKKHDFLLSASGLTGSMRLDKEELHRLLRSRDENKITGRELLLNELNESMPARKFNLDHKFDHELCHAISAFVPSNFSNPLCVTYDGMGDFNIFSRAFEVTAEGNLRQLTSSRTINKVRLFEPSRGFLQERSPGGIYSWVTHFLGFQVMADEGKVEALAAFGKPIPKLLADLHAGTNISINSGISIHDSVFWQVRRDALSSLLKQFTREDLCTTIQLYFENVFIALLKLLWDPVRYDGLCLAGGCIANVILNKRIFDEVTNSLYIAPPMADDGAAFGAALLPALRSGIPIRNILQSEKMPYWGRKFELSEVKDAIWRSGAHLPSSRYSILPEVQLDAIADLLVSGKVGAIFQGRMEFGPRALGNRSILADSRYKSMTDRINGSIKRRPLFQPFCPIILEEDRATLFSASYSNPHMTCAFTLSDSVRELFPCAAHVDGTARAQFVSKDDNPVIFRLLKEVKNKIGYGILLNTSFNKHGRTIVETPDDAILDFMDTDLDFLYIEGVLIVKK